MMNMKINEICKELDITRQGLYYMLETSKLGCHAIKKSNGRWSIDETGFEMLRELRRKSKSVLVVKEPINEHAAEEKRGMQIEIDKLATELRKEQLKSEQGLFFANSVEELARESEGLDISVKRQLLRLVKAFRSETKDTAIRKRLKAEQKAQKPNEQALENMGQQSLFE